MNYVSVKAVASYVKDIFNVEMEISNVIRLCSEALRLLKVYALGNYVVVDTISDFKVKIQNAGGIAKIQAVIRLDCEEVTSVHMEVQEIIHPPQIVFEVPDFNTVTLPAEFALNYINQIKGPYMDFTWDNPFLNFNEDNIKIAAMVVSIKKDNEGLPMIPEAAFYACCHFCLYKEMYPKMLLGKVNPNAFAFVVQDKDRKFGQARADLLIEAMNQNEVDKLFNIMTSMDRKAHNIDI